MDETLKNWLDQKVNEFNNREFITSDPISIPHAFSKKQDIEIAGLFAAVLAWGLRKTIISKSSELMKLMDDSLYDFVLNHSKKELKALEGFKHRTFNYTDLLYFVSFLNHYYGQNESLEDAFSNGLQPEDENVGNALTHFHNKFFALDWAPHRTRKHVATPVRKSACKRLNMYLRWMVRKDENGVDFGIWNQIEPSQLLCPLDVHVEKIARSLGLLKRKQTDFQAALELTENLKKFDPMDPVKYDFALFGAGVLDAKLPLTNFVSHAS